MTALRQQVSELVHEISRLDGVTVRPGISFGDLIQLERRLGVHLPEAYRVLLLETNGLEVMHGYMRLFGHGPGAPVDLVWFNDPDAWKFAYRCVRNDLEDYLFLGISADLALSACRRSDLAAPGNDPLLVTIHPTLPKPLVDDLRVSHSILRGVRSQARNPRGDLVVGRLLDHFGPLPADRLILPGPPTDDDDDEPNLELAGLLPVADALIAQADLFRQIKDLPAGTRIVGMDTWTDERGRTRLVYRFDHGDGWPAS